MFQPTPDRYFWTGTQEGFARFDRVKLDVFDKINTEAFSVTHVNAVIAGHDGTQWIETRCGRVVKFKDRKFTHLTVADGLSSGIILSLCEKRDGSPCIETPCNSLNH